MASLSDEMEYDVEEMCTMQGEDMLSDSELDTYFDRVYQAMSDILNEILNEREE